MKKMAIIVIMLLLPFLVSAQYLQLLKDIRIGSDISIPTKYISFKGKLFFSALHDSSGIEPWVSDGTSNGTYLLKDINQPALPLNYYSWSNPDKFFDFNGKLYFMAETSIVVGTAQVIKKELWVTDGTNGGTQLESIITQGGLQPGYIKVAGNKLFFTSLNSANSLSLFVCSVPIAGAQQVIDSLKFIQNPHFTALNGKLFFCQRAGNGSHLWVSDGTAVGTFKLKEVNIIPNNAREFTEYNGKLYFAADDTTKGVELWATDGTASGTHILRDIFPGIGSSNPSNFIEYNGKLYFTAENGVHGMELWRTDGTTNGTQLFKDINTSLSAASYPSELTVAGGKLFFKAVTSGWLYTIFDLCVYDGTPAGNVTSLKTFNGSIDNFIAYDGLLYFRGDDQTNHQELWKSDGQSVVRVLPSPSSTKIGPLGDYNEDWFNGFEVFNQSLVFTANYDDSFGWEPYIITGYPLNSAGVDANVGMMKFSCYPNPTNGVLNIQTDYQIKKVQVLSIAGNVLFETTDAGRQIDISTLSAGQYVIYVETIDGVGMQFFSISY